MAINSLIQTQMLSNMERIAGGKGRSLSDILEAEVDEKYLLSQKSIDRLYAQEGVKTLHRCCYLGRVESLLNAYPLASLRIRKLTPVEYERALGYPEAWVTGSFT